MSLITALIEKGSELSEVTVSVSAPIFDVGNLVDAGFYVEIENFI